MYFVRLRPNFRDLPEFCGSATVRNFRSTLQQDGNSGFSFSGSCVLETYCFVFYNVDAANSGECLLCCKVFL